MRFHPKPGDKSVMMNGRLIAVDTNYQQALKASVGLGVSALVQGDLQTALEHFCSATFRWHQRNPSIPGVPSAADDSLRITLNERLFDPLIEFMLEENDVPFNNLAIMTATCLRNDHDSPAHYTANLLVAWFLEYVDAELEKDYAPNVERSIRRYRDFMVPQLYVVEIGESIASIQKTSNTRRLHGDRRMGHIGMESHHPSEILRLPARSIQRSSSSGSAAPLSGHV